MARSTARSTESSTTIEVIRRRGGLASADYVWPVQPLNLWTLVMLGTAGIIMGTFGSLLQVQNAYGAGIPWLFPFGVTVGALIASYVFFLLALNFTRTLVPGYAIVLSFALFVLSLTGLIETGIQLFGPQPNVSTNCSRYIKHAYVDPPQSYFTLAIIEQQNLCNLWYASFAFWIVSCLFLLWMIFMAAGVNQRAQLAAVR